MDVWQLVVKKAKKIVHKINKTVHSYPKLPKFSLEEENLPFQIGSKVSKKDYNVFLDHNESSGYKFHWDNGNIYIVDLANEEHEVITSLLTQVFAIPNGGIRRSPPIVVAGQTFHYNPSDIALKIAPDIAVRSNTAHVLRPTIPHPGPPPSNTINNPHARIIYEIAIAQSTSYWEEKCVNWMNEQYVRCVFGIKIHNIRTLNRRVHRSMTARLWTRKTPATPGSTPVAGLAGIFVQEWDFGTLQFNSNNPTGCTGPNIPAYQVNIPVSDVFWNPPIVAGIPNVIGYTVVVPPVVTANNFIIDLYDIQQNVLETQ
ncbi:9434_t:CDS:2 [Cetraspora pellucida]|uniref:9434_t:CDS:1 n=1 Tax=Cetraspora pellucida TaxID=1433469 RepID=A0A9N9NII7_9GLOM|nr:9434_t:CDS:2 [Cetraspora pellucida]